MNNAKKQLAVVVALVAAGCSAKETPTPGIGATPPATSTASPSPSIGTLHVVQLGDEIQYTEGSVQASVRLSEAPAPASPEEGGDDSFRILVVVTVRSGTFAFNPNLVTYVWADAAATEHSPARIEAGDPSPAPIAAGRSKSWTLLFGSPAGAGAGGGGAKFVVYARAGTQIGTWMA